jgi:hypothetical protein
VSLASAIQVQLGQSWSGCTSLNNTGSMTRRSLPTVPRTVVDALIALAECSAASVASIAALHAFDSALT